MKIAVIDMGTNTFHLLLADVEGNSHHVFRKERVAVKIGAQGINEGFISPDAYQRGIEALSGFKKIIDQEGITTVYASATSAVRNAKNGRNFTAKIRSKLAIDVSIISGEKEANLILLGARKAIDMGNTPKLIVDIGGGSIEFIIADNHNTYWLRSFEIGGQRLIEQFHKNEPISLQEINALNQYLDLQLKVLKEAIKEYSPTTLVGCSGAFDTLSDIYCLANNIETDAKNPEYPLTIQAFYKIHKELISKTKEERLLIPGMIPLRVEMIVVASILIRYLLDEFKINDIRVSGYALKEGVLFNAIEKSKTKNLL